LVTVERGSSLKFAAIQMKRQHVGSVVVVEKDIHPLKPVGILTDRDIVLRAAVDDLDMNTTPVEKAMSKKLVMIGRGNGLSETISLMSQKGVRRVLVVDENKRLCGLLSSDDLVRILAEDLNRLGLLFAMQTRHEEKYFPEIGRLDV
jgi:CBS domain-containing protein